jgi:hypothetical protein
MQVGGKAQKNVRYRADLLRGLLRVRPVKLGHGRDVACRPLGRIKPCPKADIRDLDISTAGLSCSAQQHPPRVYRRVSAKFAQRPAPIPGRCGEDEQLQNVPIELVLSDRQPVNPVARVNVEVALVVLTSVGPLVEPLREEPDGVFQPY